MTKLTTKAIILDWAGTTVDYGCFAPVDAFIEAFKAFGITPTMDETREPMGMQKRAHIKTMLEGKRLASLWQKKTGAAPTQKDIDAIYETFEPALFKVLERYTDPLPGAVETVNQLREMGILLGSTTGYTRPMMDVVEPLAKAKGYAPDCLVCPDEVGDIGRPFPYMVWRNLEQLGVASITQVVKVGDTVADMEEGKNAGCICVGVLKGSSMLGLSEQELSAKTTEQLDWLFEDARHKYFAAGADYVIDDITQLPKLITAINEKEL